MVVILVAILVVILVAILVAILVIARITIGAAAVGLDIVIVPHMGPTCKGHAKKHVENVVVCMIMLC